MIKAKYVLVFAAIAIQLKAAGQAKEPVIVFDTGLATFSSSNETFFSADNKYLAIADVSGNVNPYIKIIDLASGLPVKTIKGENTYWQIQFSNDFHYFRYNRLPTSDADTNRFETIKNTFTGKQLFRRKVDDSRIGPKAILFGDQMIIENKDSAILKALDGAGKTFVLPTKGISPVNDYLFFTPFYGDKVIKIFDPKTGVTHNIDFSKEDPALMPPIERADLEQNKRNTFSVKAYSFTVNGGYIIAVMESIYGDNELLKVFDLEKDHVVFSAGKPKINYQDAIFSGAVQFDNIRGTITYPTKDGLAVDNIFSPALFIIPFSKPGSETITCNIDKTTGAILTWCQQFVKIFDAKTGKISYDSDQLDKTTAAGTNPPKFSGIMINPVLPYLYVKQYNKRIAPDTTGLFDIRANKFIKKEACEIIAISANGRYIYARKNFRYCLMTENLDLIKYINDCSLVTTEIEQEDSAQIKTKVDYLCALATQQSGQPDDKVFSWDIKKLQRLTTQPNGQAALDGRTVSRNGFDISILPKTPNYLSEHPTLADTLCIVQKTSGLKVNIFFPKSMVRTVDIDAVKKQVLTIVSVNFTNNFLFIHDFTGKQIGRYPLHLNNDVLLDNTKIAITGMDHFAVLQAPGFGDNEVVLSAYDLLTGRFLSEYKANEGEFNITPTGSIAIVRTHPETDTLFTRSLNTGLQTTKRLSFNSFNNNLMVYFKPEDDWYKGNYLFYPKHGKIIVEDIVKNQVLYEMPVDDDAIHSAVLSDDKKFFAFPDRNGQITLVDLQTKSVIARFTGHTDEVRKLRFTQNDQFLISSSNDGTLRLWDIKEKKERLKMINFGNDGYIMLSSEGYYRSSRSALKKVGYVVGTSVLDAGQLDVKYNRPDKVLQEMGSTDTALIQSYKKAWQKRIKKLGIDTSSFKTGYSIPDADFKNRDQITYQQTSEKLSLHITGSDSTYMLDRFNVWVNNSPVYGMRGISLRAKGSHAIDTTITVTLSNNDNLLETSITNINGIESARMPLYVKYTPPKADKSKMYFAGIGIDKFADSQYNLQWSAKDIRDLAVKFKAKYPDAEIDTLFNENVILKNVTALKAKLLHTSVNDKVVVAYSGHGLLSDDYDYYLSSYDIDFNKPEHNGIPYEALENLLDDIPARKKLMLIDACNSGEVDKDELAHYVQASPQLAANGVKTNQENKGIKLKVDPNKKVGIQNSFELMQDLFANVGKSTGATIISAAEGTQFAQEKGDLKNGVFTYSILEYFNQQPHCTISALKTYVNKRVTELTAGMQVPTARSENDVVDWEVW